MKTRFLPRFPLIALILSLLSLASCGAIAPPPEDATTRDLIIEQLALAESDYQQVLKVLVLHRQEGRLTSDEIERVTVAFNDFERYRDAARTALDIGSLVEAQSNTERLLTALQLLRDIAAAKSQTRAPPVLLEPYRYVRITV